MEMKQIRELMKAMGQTGMKVLTLKQKDFEIHLEREGEPIYQVIEPMHQDFHDENPMREELAQHRVNASVVRHENRTPYIEEKSGTFITSPMVGTFYSSSAPGEAVFIKKGDHVEPRTIVCIVEAMKVMNEIKSGLSGCVEEVMVQDGDPVEFGTPLYRIV